MTATIAGAAPVQVGLARADGVELIGELPGSGYRVAPSLVRRIDGQTVQLTPLLYATLEAIDGQRSMADIADAVSESTGRNVNEENVRTLVENKLRPLGLLAHEDGGQPALRKRNPLLGLRFRYAVTDPELTRRLTDPFRFLFRPVVVAALLVAFAAVCWWVFFRKGLAAAAYDAFERPGLLILVFAVTIVSAGFHEFGHAAAARYGGATPGVIGFGLYLVWPAFYTDVTDSYRLGRGGRLRTDLGGLYFNAVVAVAITGLWWWLGYDALLLVVATQILQMLRQLAPLVRFDGYHVLADLTGVPDLYGRIKPTLLGMLPWRWRDPKARELKWWARIIVTLWVLTVVPLLIGMLAMGVVALPRLLGSAWAGLNKQQDVFAQAWADGDMIQATARVLGIVAIGIPVAAVLYLLVRLSVKSIVGVRRVTADKPVQRGIAAVFGVAVLCGLAYAWWPDEGTYRPIEASERGTVGDIVFALGLREMGGASTAEPTRPVAASSRLTAGQRGTMWALWDNTSKPPTVNSPRLAVILVPKQPPGAFANGGGYVAAPTTFTDQGWVFPFDKPLAPEPGDNQALAVNTTDGTVVYEAAFALVWQTDEDYAMNVNEAHAYASCDNCAAVAVAYQVVFVIDEDDTNNNVAVPQNLAGALNYECVNCLTYALAQQLFVTLDRPLSEDAMAELDALWVQIAAFEKEIEAGKVPLDEIRPRLAAYTEEVKAIVEADQPGTFPTSTAPTIEASTSSTETESTTVPNTTSAVPPPPPSSTATPTPTNDPTAAPEETSSESTTEASTTADPTTTGEPTADTAPPDEPTSGETTSGGTTSDSGTTDGASGTSDGSDSDSSP